MISLENITLPTLQDKQKKLLTRLFHLNRPKRIKRDSSEPPQWKTLIYDERGLCIFSTLFKIADLFKEGITFCSQITSPRTPIPDNPAIYFVEPTTTNFEIIANDLQRQMYKEFYICFISYTNSSQPVEFAQIVKSKIQSGIPPIKLVYDCYSDFSSIHPTLFQLYDSHLKNFSTHLRQLYSLRAQSDSEQSIKLISRSLMSILITNGSCPLILYMTHTASEAISNEIINLIKENPLIRQKFESSTVGATSVSSQLSRPLLLIIDRSFDFLFPLLHSSLYEPLIHDLLGIDRNIVTLPPQGDRTVPKSFDLDESIDNFWATHHHSPYDETSDAAKAEASRLKSSIQDAEKDLKGALDEFERTNLWKQSVSTHVNIVNEIQNRISKTQMNALALLELSAMDGTLTQKDIDAVFSPQREQKFSPEDISRAIAFLYGCGAISLEQLHAEADRNGVRDKMQFIDSPLLFKPRPPQKKGGLVSLVPGLGRASVPSCPIAALVQKLVDNSGNGITQAEMDSVRVVDPLQSSETQYKWENIRKMDRSNVLCFVAGPGSYHEYAEILRYAEAAGKNITYGCTNMSRPNDYFKELSLLI